MYRNTGWDEKNPYDLYDSEFSKSKNHRYSEPGVPGVYYSMDMDTARAEVAAWGGDFDSPGRKTFVYDASLDNMLYLTDPKVRADWGVTYEDLVRTTGIQAYDYEVTHRIGKKAWEMKYNGIIAPSARYSGGVNVMLFKPSLKGPSGRGLSPITKVINFFDKFNKFNKFNNFKEAA